MGGASFPLGLFAPKYQSPRSLQMNFGVQREIRHGMVFSADYLRNVTTHTLLGVDANKAGDVSTFNQGIATNAINATNSAFGCGTGTAGVNCAIAAGATIDDYAGNGLTSPVDFGGTRLAAIGAPCAFGGINQNLGQAFFLFPIGRSVYNGLQMKLSQIAGDFRIVAALRQLVERAQAGFGSCQSRVRFFSAFVFICTDAKQSGERRDRRTL